jgi:PAS domain S-box-containing protein
MFHPSDPIGAPYAVCAISTDITERKRAEEALRSSEEHFRQIIDTAHDAFISIDSSGFISTWNPMAEKTFGWTASEAIGERLERLIIPPRYREAHSRGLQRFLSVGMGPLLNRRVEMEALHRDEHEFPVEMSITAVRIGGDYVFNAFLHDVSERKRAEENIRQLANLVESSGDAIIGIDGEGVINSWNPAAAGLYGYYSSEVVGQPADVLVPPDRMREEQEHMARVLTGEPIDLYEASRVRKDGELVEVSVTLSPVKDAVGTTVGASSISRDITERKRAEEALREVQEGFRSAFENAPIGVGLFSVDAGAKRRLLQVNASLCEITGYSAQELLATNLDAITHPLDLEEEASLVERLMAGAIPNYRIEKRYLRQDGRQVWAMHNVSTVYDSFGKLLYGVAQVEDITERKQAEKKLEEAAGELEHRAAELERSNADLQQFAYAASHDLSEPLRMVSSYVTLLSRRYQDELDQNANDFIGFAVEGVERMQALIDGLLLYSRAGTGEYTRTLVDCAGVVADVLSSIETTIDSSGAQVTVDRLPVIEADRTQLSQLFQNLITNAIKFAEGTPRVSVSAEQEGAFWHFGVSDNGIGIDPAHAERIFAVFQRLHSREQYAGSGIGLAICKRIVERQGGRIWVEPRPEGGSTFHFTIPAQPRPADDPNKSAAQDEGIQV